MDKLLPGLEAVESLHPLLVHFPVVLWPAALVLWCLALIRRRPDYLAGARAVLALATLFAGAAVFTGLQAGEILGHDRPGHEWVHVHRNWMIAATVLSAVATLFSYLARNASKGLQHIALGLLVATCGVGALGADRGALLVYKHGFGVAIDAKGELGPAPGGSEHGHDDHGGHSHK